MPICPRHAEILRPKLKTVENTLENELGGLGIGTLDDAARRIFHFLRFDGRLCEAAIVAKAQGSPA